MFFLIFQGVKNALDILKRLTKCIDSSIIRVIFTRLDEMGFSLGTGKETEELNLLQQLSDACLVVDALEPSVREELVKNFCNKELTSYRQIFEGAGFRLLFLSSY